MAGYKGPTGRCPECKETRRVTTAGNMMLHGVWKEFVQPPGQSYGRYIRRCCNGVGSPSIETQERVDVPKRDEIDATSRIVEKLCNLQDKLGLTDKQMLTGIASWLIEIGVHDGEITRWATGQTTESTSGS